MKMPTSGTTLLAQTLDEVKRGAIDLECDEDETDGTEFEIDGSDEDKAMDNEVDGDENEDRIARDTNHRLNVDQMAYPQYTFQSPKFTEQNLVQPKDQGLGRLIRAHGSGCNGILGEKTGSGNPLQTISLMAHLANQRGIWGPFLIVSPDSMLQSWEHELHSAAPQFKVLPYWGTYARNNVHAVLEDLKQVMHTQDLSFHVMVTSYDIILPELTLFRKIDWKYINLFEARTIQSDDISILRSELGFRDFDQIHSRRSGLKDDKFGRGLTAENLPTAGKIRKDETVSSRRSRGRVDGLEHLSESLSARLDSSGEFQSLYGIAFCLIRLNIIIMWIHDHMFRNQDQYAFDNRDGSQIDGLLTMDELCHGYLRKSALIDSLQETKLSEYINALSREHIVQRIQDPKVVPYISSYFDHIISRAETWKTQRKLIDADPNLELPESYVDYRKSDYANLCVISSRSWRRDLRIIYNIILQLREHIIVACSSGLLDEVSLRQLKIKMTEWQVTLQETCDVLGLPGQRLVWDSKTWWVDPRDTELSKHFLDLQPKNIVTAFPLLSNRNTDLTLSFLVPMLSLLSCIPTALAWANSPHQHGSTSDADFFQLIASTTMQLLGNATLIIPTISNAKLAGGRQGWFWTWVLAGSSTLCAVVAVPLYLTVPTEWSAVVAFAGNVMQAFVTLQLMFGI